MKYEKHCSSSDVLCVPTEESSQKTPAPSSIQVLGQYKITSGVQYAVCFNCILQGMSIDTSATVSLESPEDLAITMSSVEVTRDNLKGH